MIKIDCFTNLMQFFPLTLILFFSLIKGYTWALLLVIVIKSVSFKILFNATNDTLLRLLVFSTKLCPNSLMQMDTIAFQYINKSTLRGVLVRPGSRIKWVIIHNF